MGFNFSLVIFVATGGDGFTLLDRFVESMNLLLSGEGFFGAEETRVEFALISANLPFFKTISAKMGYRKFFAIWAWGFDRLSG